MGVLEVVQKNGDMGKQQTEAAILKMAQQLGGHDSWDDADLLSVLRWAASQLPQPS